MADFKKFRKVNNLTQGQAADLFGVSQAFISQIEKGARPIPSEFISKISEKGYLDSSMLLPDYQTPQPTTQLEFDFNKWLEVENKKADAAVMNAESMQSLVGNNDTLSRTNETLVSMLKEALRDGKDVDKKIDAITEKMESFLISSNLKPVRGVR